MRAVTREEKTRRLIIYIVLGVLLVCAVYPVLFMVMNSFKNCNDVQYFPGKIPSINELNLDGYKYVFANTQVPLPRSVLNTLIIIAIQGTFSVFLNTAAAYALARIRFAGRNLVFNLMLWSMMVPGTILLIPTFIMLQGLVNTFYPLILPGIMSAFNIFLIRQFIYSIPVDITDSAKMDGANHFKILTKIIIPMSVPVLCTVSVTLFMGTWYDLLGPQIYLRKASMQTLQVALNNLSSLVQADTVTARWAGMTLATIPLVFIFGFAQKYFIRSFTSFDLK